MKVFIAEKPSLAKAIVNALQRHSGEKFTKENGCYKASSFCVTWCYGHLFELSEIDDYIGKKTKWSEVPLPFFPETFQYKPKDDCKEQITIISNLVNAPSTTEIIHACDSDNEGEVIGRIVLQETLKRKVPITRLWSSDTTEDSLWKAYTNRKPDSDYDKQFNEGQSRAFVDWLVGINTTRAITIRSGTLYNIGRVITPIVQKVVNRDIERENFKVRKYFGIGCEYCSSSKELKTKQEAEVLAKQYNKGYEVVSFTEKERTVARPKLFSQTTLQNTMSKNGLAPDQTLKVCQSLYEKGFTTYPRTDSEYLTNEEVDKVKNILLVYGEEYQVIGKEKCFNSKKVTSHSAIIPTGKKPSSLSKQEQTVYDSIVKRFLVNFHVQDCIVKDQKCSIRVGTETINFTGMKTIQEGWNQRETLTEEEDRVLPTDLFSLGKHTNSLNWKPSQRSTQKPPLITVSALNNWCEHPFKDREEDDYTDIAKGLTIGTPATRAGIIKKAIDTGYLKLEGQNYTSTDKGREMVRVLSENSIPVNAELSVSLQNSIQTKSQVEVIKEATAFTKEVVSKIQKAEVKNMNQRETATCPWCGEPLVKIVSKDGRTFWSHPSHRNEDGEFVKDTTCAFFIGTQVKYYGQTIQLTEKQLDSLMKKGEVKVKGIESKYGTFSAKMHISKEPNVWNGKSYIQIEFTDKEYAK